MSEREARVACLHHLFEQVVEPLGYKFTTDEEAVSFLLGEIVDIEARDGAPYCPCKLRDGHRPFDMMLVCPCIPFHRKHFDAMKQCWCGLFIHLDVDDPDSLEQILPDEVPDDE